jgi:hypothetical protein
LIGYPNNFEVPKAGGNAYGQFHVDPLVRPSMVPGDGRKACMKFMAKANSPAIGDSAFYALPYTGAEASATKPTGTDFLLFQITSSSRTGMKVMDWTPANTSTGYNWFTGINVWAEVKTCSACSKTSELTITAVIGWVPAGQTCGTGTPTWGPFVAVDDRNTWTFDASPATGYQTAPPSVLLRAADVTKPVFLFIQPDKTSDKLQFVLYKEGTAKPADAGQGSQMPDAKVLPLGTPRSGNVRPGGLALDTANWYAAPFLTSGSTWTVAFGFGHEPAAAAGLVPSFLLAALLAIVALLRL